MLQAIVGVFGVGDRDRQRFWLHCQLRAITSVCFFLRIRVDDVGMAASDVAPYAHVREASERQSSHDWHAHASAQIA